MFRRRPETPAAPARPAGTSALDRYARATRPVVKAAVAQAQADGSEETGTHHLLLALVTTPGPPAWSLVTKGLDEAVLRDALDRRCGVPFPPSDRRVPLAPDRDGPLPLFSADAKAMMMVAIGVADRRKRAEVQPDDLALAVLGSSSPQVVDALDELGLDAKALRTALLTAPPT